jgi:hypothetical protein
MNDQTFSHLIIWVEQQFGDDQFELIASMIEQYQTDPDLYESAGWWRCHDNMVSAGRSTL